MGVDWYKHVKDRLDVLYDDISVDIFTNNIIRIIIFYHNDKHVYHCGKQYLDKTIDRINLTLPNVKDEMVDLLSVGL